MKPSFRHLLAVGLACCATALPAQKVHSTQDRMTTPGAPSATSIARSDDLLRRTLVCVLKRSPSKFHRLLQTAPGSEEEGAAARSFRGRANWCLPTAQAIGFANNVMRGAAAEVMYHAQFPQGVRASPTVPAQAVATWTAPRTKRGGKPELEYLHAAARCVVAKESAAVAAMLSTDSLSPQEVSAFRALQPAVSSCIDAGVKFTASRQSLRGLLAEAMLEYGLAQKDGFDTAAGRRSAASGGL